MRFLAKKNVWLIAVLMLVLVPILIVSLRAKPKPRFPLSNLPPVIVWAWERPEKLDFINTSQVGVAFLAKTITFEGDSIEVRPRLQPLELTPGTKLIAVVRIESDKKSPTTVAAEPSRLFEKAVNEIIAVSRLSNVSVIQIDFDAVVSERKFYRNLLNDVRRRLPTSTALSITALASWCAGDQWLADAPIDEAVPMLFRMGIDQRHFQSRPQFDAPICRGSAGVSTDEPVTPPAVDRLYIFNPKPWSRDSLNSALEAYKR